MATTEGTPDFGKGPDGEVPKVPESHGAIPGLDAGQQVRASAGEAAEGAGFGVTFAPWLLIKVSITYFD